MARTRVGTIIVMALLVMVAVRAADRNGDGRLSVPKYTDARMNDYAAADQNRDGALTPNETAGK